MATLIFVPSLAFETIPEPAAIVTPDGPEPGTQEDLVANVGDRVFFDFESDSLEPEARATLERWAAFLKIYSQVTVIIEGHAAGSEGTREEALMLGERRANAALEYVKSLGINPERIQSISYGSERPSVLGSTEGAHAQNRRVVMAVN